MEITVEALIQAIKDADEGAKASEGVGLLYFMDEYGTPGSYAIVAQVLKDTASAEKG